MKTLLAKKLSTFLIKRKLVLSDGPRRLPKNPLNCTILDSWVFKSFILVD